MRVERTLREHGKLVANDHPINGHRKASLGVSASPRMLPRRDDTHYVNAKDMLSLSLLQARLIDLKLPIVEGE